MSKPAVVYVRISRDREGGGLGVDRQLADCRTLAERLGLLITEVFEDNDLSAYSGKARPSYRRLLQHLRDGGATTVLCWHTDRLHRAPIELEEWIEVAEPRDVVVHTVKAGPIDLATPSGRMIARQLGAVARYESEHRSERVAAQKEHAAAAGRWLGGRRPFGFEADGTTVRPLEAELIRSATDQLLTGSSLRSIVASWNHAGALTSTGKAWKPKMLRDVLSRWRNAGVHEHRGEPGGLAQWDAIVTVEQVRAVRALFADPKRRTNGTDNARRWLLSGILTCPCGEGLRSSTGAKGRRTYRCKTPGPGHVSRIAAPVDDLVTRVVEAWLTEHDGVRTALSASAAVDVPALRATARRARRRVEEIAEMLGDGDLTAAEARTARLRAVSRLDAAEAALTAAVRTSALSRMVGSADPVAAWRVADLDVQRAVLRELMTITVERQGPGRRAFDPDTIVIRRRE